MKKLIILAVASFLLGVSPVMAEVPSGVATKAAARQDAVISRLKTRADAEITRRINALNLLITKIGAMKRLTPAQLSTFTTGIQGQITSLTSLKAKIDADTDLTTLRTDVKSVILSYRIFVVYLPQVNIMSNADRLLALVDEMTQISTKLQSRIDAAKSAGNDTTSAQSLMSDRSAKLADATTQAQNAINAVLPLTPAGYPGNKATLMSARTMLQTARTDLKAGESDATQVRQLLKGFKKSPTPTP